MRLPIIKLSRYVIAAITGVITLAGIYGLSKVIHAERDVNGKKNKKEPKATRHIKVE